MTTMRSMNPDAPNFIDASAAAARYANYVNEPKYQVANKFFDALNKEKLAEEARAEELRRYNQEFGLKQAAANREQSKYDRELNTDKALLDYQNIIRGASQGGILNINEGMSLANEYQKLVGTVGEEKAAETINAKAQMLAQRDAMKAQSDPFYAANKVQGLTINDNRYGSIDPTKLINMQTGIVNDYVKRGESLRDHNATQDYRNQTLAAQQQRYNEQRAYENEMKKLNYEEKSRNILNKEAEKNLLIEQAIALNLDPRAKSIDQLKADITEASKIMDFKRVQLKDPNTGEISTTLQAVPKTKSDAAIRQDVEAMTNEYTKLKNSVAGNSSGILSGKTNKTIDAAEKAGINPNIIESILANVNIVNQSNLFDDEEFDYTSSEFSKVTYKDPVTQKQVPLDVYLKAISESDAINRYTEKGLKGFGSIVNMSQEDKDKFAKDLEKLLSK